jgi:sugar lactone lactonase YvrE
MYEVFDVGVRVGVLALRSSGGLVMATKEGFAFWEPRTRALRLLVDPEAEKPSNRFNDGAVDCQGRFWAGTMREIPEQCSGPEGSLYRYLTDTLVHAIYAYDFDPSSGRIENRRPFISTPDEAGFPDGLTVDSEGGIWSARWGGWKVTRYDPTGKVEREIHLPVAYPTSCAFGGEHLDALYITSAWTALSMKQRKKQPYAGDLFRVNTGSKGLERPKFVEPH